MLRFALRFAAYDRTKSLGVILGIMVSTFLVGQQLGIFLFLTGAMSSLVDNTEADIWVVDDRTNDVNALGLIDARIGPQVESLPGVLKAYPLVLAGASARFREGKSAPILLVGSQPPEFRGGPWGVEEGAVGDLVEDRVVSVDYFDRENLNGARVGSIFEVGGKQVRVGVMTRGVRSFGGLYVFTTDETARALGGSPPNKVSAYLVDVEPGSDAAEVRDRINGTMFGVRAWTREDLSRSTVSTILAQSGIGYSIGTLIVFATIAGMVIIGLTMYSAAVDRLRDYGTLKAIGADNAYIRNLILVQAVLFALVGYGLGVALIEGFRIGIANTGVLFDYAPRVKIGFFALTVAIALGGAVFAMRRLARVEPASVFRS
jgi:putative ABC transport system permease protein